MIKITFGKRQLLTLTLLSFLMFSAMDLFGQITITGKVTSATDNQPVPGVNIQVKGTTTGTISDVDGNYTIQVSDNTAVLVFSMVGMLSETIEVGTKTVIDVPMTDDLVGLDEIVVIGYGTMKKSDIAGAIISVGEDEITEVKSANVMESLQGKMAGVDITPSEGRSGSGVDVLIRGKRSLNASNEPLYIVDGVPYGQNLNLNPGDIQSIEVLKDASSTAIYGSRGANGVILVTTKKGKAGQSKVYFNSYYGVTQPYQKVPVFDREGYIQAKIDANRDVNNWDSMPSLTNVFQGDELTGYEAGTETDWQDICTENGIRQDYHLGVMGGNEKIAYNTSLSYFNEDGVVLSDKFKRYTFKLNLDGKVSEMIKVGGSAIVTYRQRDGRGVRFTDAILLSPIVPAYDSANKYIYQPNFANPRKSPLAYTEDHEQEMATRIFASVYGQIDFTPSLFFKSNLGVDAENQRTGFMYPKKVPDEGLNEAGVELDNDYGYTWTNLLNYSKKFLKNSINLTLGHEVQYSRNEYFNMTGESQPFTRNLWWNMGSVDQSTNTTISFLSEKALVSAFGRANYNYNDLLLLNATGRFDGASQLKEGSKWDFFPSASAAFRLSNLDAISAISAISDLKLRFGYGASGNASVNAYSTQGLINKYALHYQFGDPGSETNYDGYRPEYLASESLTWEITKQYNLGMDFALLNNRISGNLDLYKSNTEGVILPSKLPISTGFFTVMTNAGEVETKGVELMIQTVNISRSDFNWDMNVAFAANREKIVALTSGIEQDIANGWFVGEPLDVYYDFKKIGIWQSDETEEASLFGQAPGDIKIEDVDINDSISLDGDRQILGSERPEWTGSWVNTFTYKGFDLTVNMIARMGQMIDADAYAFDPRMYDNMLEVDYWTPLNPTNEYPRYRADQAELDYEYTLRYRDGSFIKLKNLTLGYNFNSELTSRVNISKLRLYFTSNNPFILYSKLEKGIDPERNGSISWPLARTFVFGLNVEF